MANTRNHRTAAFFIESGIKKPTFFQRIALREIKYIQIPNGQRLYDLKDWNKKCPDKQFDLDK